MAEGAKRTIEGLRNDRKRAILEKGCCPFLGYSPSGTDDPMEKAGSLSPCLGGRCRLWTPVDDDSKEGDCVFKLIEKHLRKLTEGEERGE